MLTSLGIPSDSSKGIQQPRIFIKVLNYKTAWLFTVISKELKTGLPVNTYLSLQVRLLTNTISHTAFSHCLAMNSLSLDILTAKVMFQNTTSET